MNNSAIFKFENGNAAKLCSKCNSPIRSDVDFTEIDWMLYREQIKNTTLFMEFCDTCKSVGKELDNGHLNLKTK